METLIAASLFLTGIAATAAAAWLLRGRDVAAERERAMRAEAAQAMLSGALQEEKVGRAGAEVEAARVVGLDATLAELRGKLAEALDAKARLESAGAADERAHADKTAMLTSLRGEIEKDMHAIATAALEGNQVSFLRLAGQAFETHKQAAANLLEQKEQAIATLLNPVAATLEAYQKGLGGLERTHAVLASEVQNVGAQARNLVNALQASPKTRGRWGERTLQNVIELAGMTAHVDYVLQETIEGADGRLRPDLVIRLPGERRLVVDAKTPLTAYLDAHEAVDDELRQEHLRRHAQQVRTHMKQLGAKKYWEALLPVTPDFVVMFIPGENFYIAAAERDPQLMQDALADRVLIVSPTMLIGLVQTVALSWRQEKIAENARQVAELGRELYKRLATMGDHIAQLGKSLQRSVEHYSSFVGSIEGSVMPQARRFRDLEIEGTQEPLPELKPIEVMPREVRSAGDLIVGTAEIISLTTGERAQTND